MAGITPTGFDAKTLQQILAEIQAQQLSDIDPALNVTASSVLGQINGIMAEKLAEEWELAEDVYNSQYPDTATGVSLDNVASILGLVRQGATTTTVAGKVTLDAATTLPIGSVANIVGFSQFQFTTDAEVINAGGVPAELDVGFTAVDAGPIEVNIGTLTEIFTPVTGWTAVNNEVVGITGASLETDNELRTRMQSQFALQGRATIEAIRSAVLGVAGVTSATVRENTSPEVVGTLRPHSVNVTVNGGFDDATMAQVIFDTKAGGIETSGNIEEPHTDSQGIVTTIRWDVPVTVSLWIDVTLTFDANNYPDDGDALVADAVQVHINALEVGHDVLITPLACAIIDGVAGVIDIAVGGLKVDDFENPTSTTNFPIGVSEEADTPISGNQVTVTSTVFMP